MCLAIPVEVVDVINDQWAKVRVGNVEKNINISLVAEVVAGDFLILHSGYALTRLDKDEAEKTLALFDEMGRK